MHCKVHYEILLQTSKICILSKKIRNESTKNVPFNVTNDQSKHVAFHPLSPAHLAFSRCYFINLDYVLLFCHLKYLSSGLTLIRMLDISFLACTKVELWDLTVCIVVNGEKFQSRAVTLSLVRQCPILNLTEMFSLQQCV